MKTYSVFKKPEITKLELKMVFVPLLKLLMKTRGLFLGDNQNKFSKSYLQYD